MFGFFKKSSNNITFDLKVDIHSHLIPGVDDGAENIDDSIELIKKFIDLGYTKLITTPHIMADYYKNTPETINSGLQKLKEKIAELGLNIHIEAAAEYYLDDGFNKLLKSAEMLTFGDNYLLFETSYTQRPFALNDTIFEIASKGYKPVIAHPERYRYIKNFKEYKKLKELGCYFQINLNSLNGGYGESAKKRVDYIVENGLIDFLGSDCHNIKHIKGIKSILNNKKLMQNIYNKNKILNMSL